MGLTPTVFSIEDLMRRIDQIQSPSVKPIRIFSGELKFGADVKDIASLDPRVRENFFKDKFPLCMTVEGVPCNEICMWFKQESCDKTTTN